MNKIQILILAIASLLTACGNEKEIKHESSLVDLVNPLMGTDSDHGLSKW